MPDDRPDRGSGNTGAWQDKDGKISEGFIMNRYILHTKSRARGRLKYLVFGLAAVMAAGAVGYTAHSIGTARAKSRETVSIYTEEELEQYLQSERAVPAGRRSGIGLALPVHRY